MRVGRQPYLITCHVTEPCINYNHELQPKASLETLGPSNSGFPEANFLEFHLGEQRPAQTRICVKYEDARLGQSLAGSR